MPMGRSGPTALAGELQPPDVLGRVGADLELDHLEAVVDGLPAQPGQLGVVVAQPARSGGVRGVSDLEQLGGALGPPALGGAQDRQRLVLGERVAQVAEVDQVDQLLGAELAEQLPDGLAGPAGRQIPDGVDDGAGRHVHRPLLRPQPAQLAVADQPTGEGPQVGDRLVHVHARHQRFERLDRRRLQVVAATDGEDQAVAHLAARGPQHQVGRGVVGERVHRVGTVALPRGGEPYVVDLQRDDPGGRVRVGHIGFLTGGVVAGKQCPLSYAAHACGRRRSARSG